MWKNFKIKHFVASKCTLWKWKILPWKLVKWEFQYTQALIINISKSNYNIVEGKAGEEKEKREVREERKKQCCYHSKVKGLSEDQIIFSPHVTY